ncbi:MAG: helix-turn-helix transcriptional regulator [Anaeromyxobacter sp.]
MPARKDPLLEAFGTRLGLVRRSAGFTQAQLGSALGISTAYVSILERGHRNPPITLVLGIARALAVPATSLVE